MTIELIERRADGVELYRLKNDKLEAQVMTYGGTLMKLIARDKNGVARDVVLGYDTVEEYFTDDSFQGRIVGRMANRIAGAAFTLNGRRYELVKNDGANNLHTGPGGFATTNLKAEPTAEGLKLSCTVPDLADGFPGTLDFSATYRLDGDRLIIRYEAVSDRDTVVNFTNHSYFNLTGGPADIGGHVLTLAADQYCPVNDEVLATGEHADVTGTPFDFRKGAALGERLAMDNRQLTLAGGIDHSFVFSAGSDQAKLYNPENGLELVVSTDLPETQIYTCNMLSDRQGKGGKMGKRVGVCIETQFEPNSINSQSPSPMVLRAGERFFSETSFTLKAV